MLWWVSFLQILTYLFFIPLLRIFFDQSVIGLNYSFWLATIFIVIFVLTKMMAHFFIRPIPPQKNFICPKFSNYGKIILIGWAITYIVISVIYGLYNRRASESAALTMFADIPPVILVIFRSLEVTLPYVVSIILMRFINSKKMAGEKVLFASLLLAFMFSGASYSRAHMGLFLMSLLIIAQNSLTPRVLLRLMRNFLLAGVAVVVAVTAARMTVVTEQRPVDEYFLHEFLARLDGLDVLSKVDGQHEISWFGIHTEALLNPLIASIPFWDGAIDLKRDGMTSPKAILMKEEFGSHQRDINSFVILDTYYVGGIFGVLLVGLLISFLMCLVDQRIGLVSNHNIQVFLVAVAINMIALEREAATIFIGIFRDWVLLMLVSCVLIKRDAIFAVKNGN